MRSEASLPREDARSVTSESQTAKADRSRKAKTRIFAIIVISSNALGNFSLTWGMRHRPATLTFSPADYLAAIFSPWVFLGISLLILWLLSRMALLSWADLSYVLPVTSLGYVASALIGHFFLDEQITSWRWLGTILIVAGTMLVGRDAPRTESPASETALQGAGENTR